MESSVSLSWCIRQGTRGEGDGDADYLPPMLTANNATTALLILTLITSELAICNLNRTHTYYVDIEMKLKFDIASQKKHAGSKIKSDVDSVVLRVGNSCYYAPASRGGH